MRGDLVSVALQGDYGKPRPALVIQANQYGNHPSVTFLPITGELVSGAASLRVTIQPTAHNGLQKPSQVMVDKATTLPREKIGPAFGRIGAEALIEVERCLAVFLGIAK